MGVRQLGWPILVVGASLLTGCVTQSDGFKARAVESASSRIKGGSNALVEAQGLLSVGNPGLALEAFRNIQREQPSAEALAGIAACYVAMGRDDLAKTNLERALALAPRSAELLRAIALVMDRLGMDAESANARLQADEIMAATEQADAPDLSPTPHATPPAAATVVSEKLLAAQPDDRPPASGVAQRAIAEVAKEIHRLVKPEGSATSITVSLPPLPALPKERYARPRIERLSAKEVALVTTGKPYWPQAALKRKQASADDPRWSRARTASATPNVRLLNAARAEGLASAARAGLTERGWRRIEIGDHTDVRARSLVLYPAGKRRIGMSLARHFGIAAAQSRGETVTILLGRDVVSRLDS